MILLSTAYFPPISYFVLLAREEKILLEAEENYHKQSYRNRCRIMTSAGEFSLSLPIKKTGEKIAIRDAEIDLEKPWQHQHWRAIHSAYGSSPYFPHYGDVVRDQIYSGESNLFKFNLEIIAAIAQLINIHPAIAETTQFKKDASDKEDYRTRIHPKKTALFSLPAYLQTFADRLPFIADLSILDLLFNMGPEARTYITQAGN